MKINTSKPRTPTRKKSYRGFLVIIGNIDVVVPLSFAVCLSDQLGSRVVNLGQPCFDVGVHIGVIEFGLCVLHQVRNVDLMKFRAA